MHLKEQHKAQSIWRTLKIWAAYMLVKLFYRNDEEVIVLVGGNLGEKYEDNAAVFHQYLVENYADQMSIYWMYDPNYDYVDKHPIPQAVPLGSFKNYLLFFRATYSVHGHSIIYDLAPSMDRFIFLNNKTVMMHISHGIECFKKILIQKEDEPLLARCDYFNCASPYEYEIKSKHWEVPEEKLFVTGMARFDRLIPDSPPSAIRRILLMFTWREWLFGLSEEQFLKSEYFQSTVGLLKNERLHHMAETHEIEIRIALHPFMKKYEHFFANDERFNGRISYFTFDEVLLMDEVKAADMLLTDYSSIAWDFLYMNKPIIFYTFDQEEFLANRGSYLDLAKDLFGYKANTEEEVIACFSQIVEKGNLANPHFGRAGNYIGFFDERNCERLASALFSKEQKTKRFHTESILNNF